MLFQLRSVSYMLRLDIMNASEEDSFLRLVELRPSFRIRNALRLASLVERGGDPCMILRGSDASRISERSLRQISRLKFIFQWLVFLYTAVENRPNMGLDRTMLTIGGQELAEKPP